MVLLQDYYSVRAAAEEIGIRFRTLHKRINRGAVRVERINSIVLVPKAEVARLKGDDIA